MRLSSLQITRVTLINWKGVKEKELHNTDGIKKKKSNKILEEKHKKF